jgi:hypothetical protein
MPLMASDRTIAANRLNAQKSTGPRSLEGKRRSRQNATKHGLTATQVLIPGEDPAEYETRYQEMLNEYQPEGPAEVQLVERATSLLWRLRRVPAFEAALIKWSTSDPGRDEFFDLTKITQIKRTSSAVAELGAAIERLLSQDLIGKLSRYEATTQKQLSWTLMELRQLKSNRPNLAKVNQPGTRELACLPPPE